MDLEVYRSGDLRIGRILTSEQVIRQVGGVAVVSVLQDISGVYRGNQFEGKFRYMRIWAKIEGVLQVIAGSCVNAEQSAVE